MTHEDGSKPPCPLCGSQDSRTIETRWVEANAWTRRRRECLTCRARFTTREWIDPREPAVRLAPGRLA